MQALLTKNPRLFIPSGTALLGWRGEVGDGPLQLGRAGLEQRSDGRLQLGCGTKNKSMCLMRMCGAGEVKLATGGCSSDEQAWSRGWTGDYSLDVVQKNSWCLTRMCGGCFTILPAIHPTELRSTSTNRDEMKKGTLMLRTVVVSSGSRLASNSDG
jgi:hypothetical protein